MHFSLLAGAGLVGLLDAALLAPLGDAGFRREAVLLVLSADLLLAALLGLALHALSRGLPRLRPATGTSFWIGCAVATACPLIRALESWELGLGAALLCAAVAPLVGRLLTPPAAATRVLMAAALLGLGICASLRPSLVPALPASSAGLVPSGRPDIVLVSVDTLRADALAEESPCTPHLNAQRRHGISAAYALAPSPVTLPSHITMLSGLSVASHGAASNRGRLDDSVRLLSERLREGGYRTAAVVSNYLIRSDAGFGRGVETFDDAPIVQGGPVAEFRRLLKQATWWGRLGLAGWVDQSFGTLLYGRTIPPDGGLRGNGRHTTDAALHLLRRLQQGDAPFYLFVHYMDPHTPYAPPPGALTACGPPAPLPSRYPESDEGAGWRLVWRIGHDLQSGVAEAPAAVAHLRDLYDAEVVFLDQMVGELLARIEAGRRPTVFLLTADHGEQFGDHGQVSHGNSIYESGLRVPFVLTAPGIAPRRLEHPPHLEDVVPTLLALARLPADGLPGRDLTRPEGPARPHLARLGPRVAVRADGWKLILDSLPESDDPGAPAPRRELYRIARDPEESRNLVEREPRVAAALERSARLALQNVPDSGTLEKPSEEHLAALRAMGYLGE